MIFVRDIIDYINKIAPFDFQEDWDNSGFLVGNRDEEVKKIGFCLDLCDESLQSAIEQNVNLVITHHPVIFFAKKNVLSDSIVYKAVKNGLNVLSTHTCFDAADGGVNDVLCSVLGLKNVQKVDDGCNFPILRTGNTEAVQPEDFAKLVASKLNTVVRLSSGGKEITKVAVCGGAGGDLWEYALAAGADAYVTGEARHHEHIEAAAKGLTLIVAGHYETENPAVYALKEKVSAKFNQLETVILKQTNPVEYINNGT